ncbi:MAG: porin [Alphaproteobacteria bacterium]
MINDGRAPKLSYITPWLGNTKFGFSYTPDNAHRRGMVSRYTDYEKTMDGYVWAMQNKWQLSSSVLYTSAGYGIFNRTDKEASVGVRWQKAVLILAPVIKSLCRRKRKCYCNRLVSMPFCRHILITTVKSEVWNFSLGYDFGRYKTNVAYFQSEAANTRHRDVFYLWSNAYRLSKNLDIVMIGSYLNAHGDKAHSDDNAKGYALIGGFSI